MRILIDARMYGLENAGLGRYINNLISHLAIRDNKNNYVILLRKKYFESLELPVNWKKVLADFRHYSFTEQCMLPFLIINEKPDVVHFPHFNVPVFYCWFSKLINKGGYIVTIHDKLMHQQKGLEATTLPPFLYFIKRLGYGFVFYTAVKFSETILVPSESVKHQLNSEYLFLKNKVFVTYEGVDVNILDGYTPKIPKPYFVFAGNAYPHKNLKRLIQAILLLNKNYAHPVFLAISSARNNFTQKIDNLISSLKASEFVKMLGFVPDNELGALYKNSEGFVFASLSEGFGLPGLEAIGTGTVLLASDIPVFKEIYQNQAIYFDPLDYSSIEKAMEFVLNLNNAERQQIIESGKQFVKRYSWDKMAEETLNIYEKYSK